MLAGLGLTSWACSHGGSPETASGGAAPLLIAHRGASAYAPEHTLAAYRMALEQGADFIEPDLQVTRDGVLIALHDLTLERTTDVEERFPRRFREDTVRGEIVRRWPVSDFTLAEIQRLDAGSWFAEAYRGERVPTFSQVLELARGRAGVIPETKAPEVYGALGFEMERLLLHDLEEAGWLGVGGPSRVIVQSFSLESLRVLREKLGSDLPTVFLLSGQGAGAWTSMDALSRLSEWVSGIGPNKGVVLRDPELVSRAHRVGLGVFPWTFRATAASDPDSPEGVEAEMRHFLCNLRVDGLFTDNPDRFPAAAECERVPYGVTSAAWETPNPSGWRSAPPPSGRLGG